MRKSVCKRVVAVITAATMMITMTPVGNAQAAKKAKVTSVTVKDKKISLKKGKTFTIKVTVKGSGKFSKKVSFKSSNKKIATVSTKGKITAKKKGTATITVTSKANKKKTAKVKVTVTEDKKLKPEEKVGQYPSADKTGYKQVWADEFNAKKLNRDDWNVELHEAGWVNNEQQEYVDSEKNIYLKDGTLVIKPIEKTAADGTKSYTSGRISTQNKQDFKYGMFEARLKVPKGQGFWPAFWLLPTDESFYGQWPKCGEIDGLEVLGSETEKLQGTIHYGASAEKHKQEYGTYTIPEGEKDFADAYHVFDVEWQPGKITWYVDGIKYFETSSWYTEVEGQGRKTYPAPFDQPFYVILNLAIGGDMGGNVDETTVFKNQQYSVDYVRVYQKDSYDENVTEPVAAEIELRDPDANGNYIENGDLSVAEDLTDDVAWKFMTQQNGEGTAEIKDGKIIVKTTKEGDVDYAVQLMSWGLPLRKNSSYTLSFDAKAAEARTIVAAITAPDRGYSRYLEDKTVNLTTETQTFTYDFVMRDDSDANARLDLQLGKAGSTAELEISNVKLVKTADNVSAESEKKTKRANGNYVYNGNFDEGTARLGFWEISDADKANVSVTNENLVRKLKVVAPEGTTAEKPVVVAQSDLGLTAVGKYEISYKASKENAAADDKFLVVSFAGKNYETALTKEETKYSQMFELTEAMKQEDADFALKFTAPGTYYVDNVMVAEYAKIKNGSFNANLEGYETYIHESAKADYVVDSISEDNAFSTTINDTGTENWHIQLIQNGVSLEKGKFYRLSFKAKSSLDRKIECVIDGGSKNDYKAYFTAMQPELKKDYRIFTQDFEMKDATDDSARFDIALGKIDEQITKQHSISIDDITLEEIDAKDADVSKMIVTEASSNLLKNADFAKGKEGWNVTAVADAANVTLKDGKATFPLTSVGENAWDVALEQTGLKLEKDAKYKLTFKASSTKDRKISVGFFTAGDKWQGGSDPELTSTAKEYTVEFTPADLPASPSEASLKFTLGVFTDYSSGSAVKVDTPVSDIVISDLKFEKLS